MSTPSADVLIVGGGIVGLTLARELARRGAGRVRVLEKEPEVGRHASGRNSGVLHSGVYYGADTLKARVCMRGSALMQAYAAEHGVRLERTGKVILATGPDAAARIEALHAQGLRNGVRLARLNAAELSALEPEAAPGAEALHSPDTAVIDSRGVLRSLVAELGASGVQVDTGRGLLGVDPKRGVARTRRGDVRYGVLVNAAGLFADRVAHALGVGERYQVLPFKGLYRFLTDEAAGRFRGSLYPVPDLRMPFLGVHVTRGVDGSVSLGPTAIPAFGRENYGLLSGLRPGDALRMGWLLGRMVALDRQGLRRLVVAELPHYTRAGLLADARRLAPRLDPRDLSDRTKVGLRAQLVDTRALSLVLDFVVEEGPASLHVLNAISPAFTSAFALAELLADRITGKAPPPPPSTPSDHPPR